MLLLAFSLPWVIFLPLYLFSILRSSFRNWQKLEGWRDIAGWAALLVFQLGLLGGTGTLLYFVVGFGVMDYGF